MRDGEVGGRREMGEVGERWEEEEGRRWGRREEKMGWEGGERYII